MERLELRARALELKNKSLSAHLDSMVDKLCFCTRAEVTSQVVGSDLSNWRNTDCYIQILKESRHSRGEEGESRSGSGGSYRLPVATGCQYGCE